MLPFRLQSVKVYMLPVDSTIPWMICLYRHCGSMIDRGLSAVRSDDETNPIVVVFHPHIKDIGDSMSSSAVEKFANECGRVDWVKIDTDIFTNTSGSQKDSPVDDTVADTEHDSIEDMSTDTGVAQSDSQGEQSRDWRKTIEEVHEKLRPRCGILIKPKALGKEHREALKQMGINVKSE